MANSTGFQKRIARLNNNASEYVVETYMEDLGDLPDIGVFLMEILDINDPSRDSLARVATVADYTAFGTDRITAVASSLRFYRASAATKIYTSVEVAVAAAGLIEGNVDVLVKDFQAFLFPNFDTSTIVGPPAQYEGITWPLVVDSYKEELINNYTDARDARVAQDTVVVDKATECAVKQATTTQFQTEVSALTAIQTALAGLKNALTDPIGGAQAKLKAALDASTAFSGKAQAGSDAYQADVALSRALQAKVVDGGTSYSVNDISTVVPAGAPITADATLRVLAETGGVVDELEVVIRGIYTASDIPSNPAGTIGGNGDLTVIIDWGTIIDAEAAVSWPIFNPTTGTMGGDIVTLNTALGEGYGSIGELAISVTLINSKISEIDGLLVTASGSLSTAQGEENTCAQQLVTETTAQTQLVNAEATALQNIKDVCPDFDETGI